MGLKSPPINYVAPRQGDFDRAGDKHCPTCGAPWKRKALRVCRRCGDPIARGRRYRIVPVGPGLFAVEHRDCTETRPPQVHTEVSGIPAGAIDDALMHYIETGDSSPLLTKIDMYNASIHARASVQKTPDHQPKDTS